ncbi:zinc finger protein 723-like [Latimeria chalumnae]|uniref:zinc finger protein 723-like n=1 Tax=Latimeria chalumnae TaxID=7897 RepID=UPI00313B42FA
MEIVVLRPETDRICFADPEAVCDRASAHSQEETSNMPANPNQLQIEETFEDIKMYFNKDEWAELQDWEKEVYKSLKEHYDIIISFGYYIPKPDFMHEIKERHQMFDCILSHCSWDVQPETNAVSNLIESPFIVHPNIHPISNATIMEKSGVEQNENTHQYTVQQYQERNAVQSKEYSFYCCSECKEKFNCLEVLQRHLEIHEVKHNQCISYRRERNHSNIIIPHREEARGRARAEQQNCTESLMQSIYQPTQTGKKQDHCSKDQQNSSQQPFKLGQEGIHMGEKTQNSAASARKVKSSSTINEYKQIIPSVKLYKCTECRKSFTQVGALNIHKQTHTGLKPHKCMECGKSYAQVRGLTLHKRTHTKEKPYKCLQCGKSFTWAQSFKIHKQTHTGEKQYICTECGKSFTQFENLKVHKRLHTGEKPYQCTECGKHFTQGTVLKKHKLTHTGEKPYKCTECGKCFTQVAVLKRHKMTHTGEKPYKCPECGKSFTQLWGLNIHKQTHTGLKPHKCMECGMSYAQVRGLTLHKRTHTKEKPFKCTVCGKGFTWAQSLKTHKQTHRGEKLYIHTE